MTTTADSLVDRVKTTVTMPNNQVLLTDARILDLMNEEIDSELVPIISSVNQNFFVALEEEALTKDQEAYSIPYRSIGRSLRDLKITDGNSVRNMSEIPLEDAHLFRSQSLPQSFYFQGDKIIVVPAPNATNLSLQKFYLLKPNNLVLLSSAGKVTGISGSVITLDSVPSTFVTNATIDMIYGSQGNSLKAMDIAISGVSGNQVTVGSVPSAPDALAVGDYLALSCETPVLQLPDEIVPLLVFRTAKRCLEALGDYEGSTALEKEILRKKKQFEKLIAPRSEGSSIKIMNRYGLLRGYRGRYTRGIIY